MSKTLRALLITVGSLALLSFLLSCGLVAAIAIPGDAAPIENAAEFQALVDDAGWGFPVTGECEPKANIFGGQTICEARGT